LEKDYPSIATEVYVPPFVSSTSVTTPITEVEESSELPIVVDQKIVEDYYQALQSELEENPDTPHCTASFDYGTGSEPSSGYQQMFTAFFEQPEVDLYYYDEPTNNYFKIDTLTASTQYHYWNDDSQ
jgi:hypothetical protein